MTPAKFFLLGVKEVREVKEVKAICFENTGVKNSEVKPLPLLIIARQHCANQFIMNYEFFITTDAIKL